MGAWGHGIYEDDTAGDWGAEECRVLLAQAKEVAESKDLALADFSGAQEEGKDPTFGHSYHGEVFNEGPRQAAYRMGGTGNVHFPVSQLRGRLQDLFDQGVGQLHGFWYFEAERTFRQIAANDPDCFETAGGSILVFKQRASGTC